MESCYAGSSGIPLSVLNHYTLHMNNYYWTLKRLLLLLIFVSGLGEAYSQGRTIKGKVVAQDDGSGIPGVNILVKGTTTGAVTDPDGNFALAVPDNSTLVVSVI